MHILQDYWVICLYNHGIVLLNTNNEYANFPPNPLNQSVHEATAEYLHIDILVALCF